MKGRQGAVGPNNNQHGNPPSMRPHQMTPQELHEAQNPQDQFSPDINENTSGDGGGLFYFKKKMSGNFLCITFSLG